MANLGNSIINGKLRVINETNTGTLTVNGSSVSLLSGNIKDNSTSTAIVSAKQVADYISSQSVTPKFDGGTISGGGLTAGEGSASAVGTGITLGAATNSKPDSGYYITVTGSGKVSRAAITTSNVLYNGAVNGWVNIADNTKALDGKSSAATSASSNTATVYYPITAGSITNNTSGGTSTATINRGKQIKIGAGYYPSDLYYTAQGAPTLSGDAAAANVLTGKTFYNSSYTKVTGTMPNNGALGTTITTQGGTYTIPAGYTSGGTVTANIGTGSYSASGTAGTGSMSGRVVTIPFTPKATIGTAGYIAKGSANGTVVNGTYTVGAGSYSASGTAGAGSIEGNVVTIPFTPKATVSTAGYVAKGDKTGDVVNGTYTITTGTVTQPSATQKGASASLSGTTITLSKSVTPNVTTAGIISTGTAGTVTLQGTVPTESKTATTSGDITPTNGKLLSKVTVPSASPKFTGGTVSGGDLSGGDLSVTTNYSGTPTVTVSNGSDTNMTNITVGTKAQSGYPYYFKVSGASSALSGKTKATRAAVARTAIKRAAVTYDGAVDGWVEVSSGTSALTANNTAIAANNAVIAATSVEPTVTVNAGSGSTYVGIKAAVITNGFVTGAGYIPDDDTAAYKTQYNATDDCVDILFN